MQEALLQNPVLALFLVIAIGYGLGRVRIGNFRMGLAAVLFVGLAFGAIFRNVSVPTVMVYFGLSLFVYCIGLASGPSFFTTLKQNGVRDVGFVVVMLTLTATLTVGLHFLLKLDPQTTAGLYAGSTTNTPALAGLIDLIAQTSATQERAGAIAQQAVAGYSLAYPMGIIGTILAFGIIQKLLRIDYPKELEKLRDKYPVQRDITNANVEITNPDVVGVPIRDLKHRFHLNIIFGRRIRGEETVLTNWDNSFQLGDKVVVVGDRDAVHRTIDLIGEQLGELPPAEDEEYIVKRIFLSNPDIAGQSLSAL